MSGNMIESSPLRFAYISFSWLQCILVLILYQRRLPCQISGLLLSIVTHPAVSASVVSSISLSLLFFVSRNDNLETPFHRILAFIYIIHSIVLGSSLIREQVVYGELGSALGKVVIIGAALCFAWAFLGISKLVRLGKSSHLCFTEV